MCPCKGRRQLHFRHTRRDNASVLQNMMDWAVLSAGCAESGITRELVKEEKSPAAASLKSEEAPSVHKSSSADELKQVKQEEPDNEQQPSQSSVKVEHTEAYEQKEKGTKRSAGSPPQKSPPKKAARERRGRPEHLTSSRGEKGPNGQLPDQEFKVRCQCGLLRRSDKYEHPKSVAMPF